MSNFLHRQQYHHEAADTKYSAGIAASDSDSCWQSVMPRPLHLVLPDNGSSWYDGAIDAILDCSLRS